MSKAKIERSTKGLAEAMFEELDNLRNDKSTPQQAIAKASLGKVVIATIRLELDIARFVTEGKLDCIQSIPLSREVGNENVSTMRKPAGD